MKKLLSVISILCLPLFSMQAQDAPKGSGTTAQNGSADTSAKSVKKKGCCKKKKKAKAITHSAPNQAQIDSVKKAKTETKFK